MSIFDTLSGGPLFGGISKAIDSKPAQERAGQIQLKATQLGIDEARAARQQSRADILPFQTEGSGGLSGLAALMTNQGTQSQFIQNNPFFKAQADELQRNLFNQQAARGKLGSGETAQKLQNSLLQLGNGLLNQNITQRFNQSVLGANAAARQATGTQSAASQISELLTQGANAQGAGIVGAQNSRTNRNQQLGMAALSAFSDRRVKKDIEKIGEYKDLPVYRFKYIWDDEYQIGFMAQEVQEIYPEAVFSINGILAVNYEKVIYAH